MAAEGGGIRPVRGQAPALVRGEAGGKRRHTAARARRSPPSRQSVTPRSSAPCVVIAPTIPGRAGPDSIRFAPSLPRWRPGGLRGPAAAAIVAGDEDPSRRHDRDVAVGRGRTGPGPRSPRRPRSTPSSGGRWSASASPASRWGSSATDASARGRLRAGQRRAGRARSRPRTMFQSGSVGKQFAAALVLLLADEGRLGVDDPVSKWMPGRPPLERHHRPPSAHPHVRHRGVHGQHRPPPRVHGRRPPADGLPASAGLPARAELEVQQHRLRRARHPDRQGHGPVLRRPPAASGSSVPSA